MFLKTRITMNESRIIHKYNKSIVFQLITYYQQTKTRDAASSLPIQAFGLP